MQDETRLTLDTLGSLDDGTVRLLVDAAIREALDDCDNRALLDKPRKVTITLELRPRVNNLGAMTSVEAGVSVKKGIPPRAGNSSILRAAIEGDQAVAFLPEEYAQELFPVKGN